MAGSKVRRALLAAAAAVAVVVAGPDAALAAEVDAEILAEGNTLTPTSAPPAQAVSGTAAVPKVAGAQVVMRDQFGVSGGGLRAMTGGLVFFDVMDKRGVEHGRTVGLSGGGWSVMVEEAMGAGAALKKLDEHTKTNLLGAPFDGAAAGLSSSADLWKVYYAWKSYIEDSFVKPLGVTFKEEGEAEVLVGTTITDKSGGDVMRSCMTQFFGPKSKHFMGVMNCNTYHAESLVTNPNQVALQPGWPAKERGGLYLDRTNQAILTSTAYLYAAFNFLGRGIPFQLKTEKVTGAKSDFWVEFWDLGLQCNLPITPVRLGSPGVSVLADLSDDGSELFKSLDTGCRTYWSYSHDITFAQSKEPLVWNGQRLNVPKAVADPEVGKYVRRIDFSLRGKPTGRSALVVTMGAMSNSKMLAPEQRFLGLETVSGLNPKRYDRAAFLKLNVQVRAFYERVWELLLSP